jgi:DNA polymerase
MLTDLPIYVVDFETRSYKNVKHVGAWRYAEDPTTEILCLGYKRKGSDTKGLWVPELPFPQELLDHIEAGGTFEAHNAQFERAIWIHILKKKLGIPFPTKWTDTQAVCAYRGIPLALDNAGDALGLPIKKDKRGKYLLNTLSVPKWGTKAEPDRIYREDFDLMQELYDYCLQDTDAEDCLGDTLGELPPPEYYLWTLDQRINQRGVLIDVEAVEKALDVIKAVEEKLNGELQEITDNEVEKATQRDRMMKWFHSQGLHLENLTKDTLETYLTKDKNDKYVNLEGCDPKIIRALEIRGQLARASTKKLEKMLMVVSRDGRIRGLLQYHGAGTGRWAGRLVQPQNFPRALFKADMEKLIEYIKNGDYELLDFAYDSAMDAVATSLRGMFIAAPDKTFRICDFSAIEARVVFWVANCKVGLEVFHKSDRGESEDIYCVTASDLVGFEVQKKKHGHERQLGKITVLGCGYQMGWSKLQFQAEKDYKVLLEDHEAQKMVSVYREKYKEVKWLWNGLEEAAVDTVKTGKPHGYNNIAYAMVEDNAGTWLTCILPNGRRLWYYDPVIEKIEWYGRWKDSLSYMGRDNKKGGSWGRVRTYGGMLTENVVQAIARDLMAEAMIRVEVAGYPIVLTVHDEIIAETLKTFGSQEEFEQLMAINPDWSEGCPIAVEGGSVTRYQKV